MATQIAALDAKQKLSELLYHAMGRDPSTKHGTPKSRSMARASDNIRNKYDGFSKCLEAIKKIPLPDLGRYHFGCKCLLSEDMQDGFVWRGVEVIDPLTPEGQERLQKVIA